MASLFIAYIEIGEKLSIRITEYTITKDTPKRIYFDNRGNEEFVDLMKTNTGFYPTDKFRTVQQYRGVYTQAYLEEQGINLIQYVKSTASMYGHQILQERRDILDKLSESIDSTILGDLEISRKWVKDEIPEKT